MYTEIQEKNNKKYYYRVRSVREGNKVKKQKKYLGVNLSKEELRKKEIEADKGLQSPLDALLTKEEIARLEKIKKDYKKEDKRSWQNRYEAFLADFTYNTNAIEGSTLTLKETSLILFERLSPKGKSLREINEVLNHKKAFDFLLSHKEDIDKEFICTLQKLIVSETLSKDLDSQIGKYREIQVFIRGADFVPPSPENVKKEMRNLLVWYSRNKNKLQPLVLSAYFHAAFECIHPFVDGNGRTGRLLLNFILHKNGYPMVNIPNSRRLEYYTCLENARKGDLRSFVKFLFELLMSTEIYI